MPKLHWKATAKGSFEQKLSLMQFLRGLTIKNLVKIKINYKRVFWTTRGVTQMYDLNTLLGVPNFHLKHPFGDKEQFIFILVMVPNKIALHFGKL